MSVCLADHIDTSRAAPGLLPLSIGAGAYLLLLFTGDTLLQDSDSFWQIKVGQWILDHGAVPYTDVYSFTRSGAPWMSNAWLSQVLYAIAYAHWGWTGTVVLASLAIAAALVLLVHLLEPYFEPAHRILIAMLALALSWHHLLARPHVLALPMMVGWIGGLIRTADRRALPSWTLLPLIALWANLHGGFVLGLALLAPIAIEAMANAAPSERIAVTTHWTLFAVGALAASCCTPYGWATPMAAARILDLGQVLSVLSEWRAADFSSFGLFEALLLGFVGLALLRGIVVPLPRIVLLLLLTHMALSHVRSLDALAFLAPLGLAKPFADTAGPRHPRTEALGGEQRSYASLLAILAIGIGTLTSTLSYAAHHDFVFVKSQMPVAAVAAIEQHGANRIFNGYEFGGYLIWSDIPTFIDGRAELYGETHVLNYFDAISGRNIDQLTALLDQNQISATLLAPSTPAAQLLDHISGWTRLYSDDVAVVHVRTSQASKPEPAFGGSN